MLPLFFSIWSMPDSSPRALAMLFGDHSAFFGAVLPSVSLSPRTWRNGTSLVALDPDPLSDYVRGKGAQEVVAQAGHPR